MTTKKPLLWLVAIVAVLLLMGGSFWAGTYYETQTRATRFGGFANMTPEQRQQAMQQSGRMPGFGSQAQRQGSATLTGRVDKVTDDTITITTQVGSLKVLSSNSTLVSKTTSAKLGDVAKGAEILVQGKRDKDGNIEASKVIIISP